jgi:excisionase family DNA binding protein
MPDRASDAPPEQLFRVQEAADFLNIHRSTLHLAVRRKLVVPDRFTPGGHARFRRATLEAFAERLAQQPVTGTARILSQLAPTLTQPDGLGQFCHLAFARIRQAMPALTMCSVTRLRPTPDDPYALVDVAQEGFPPRLRELFVQLRPDLEFAVTTVLRTREPEVCENTTTGRTLRLGTDRLVRRGGLGAYAALPLLAGDEALGVLVVASAKPHAFPAWEVAFLQSIAADLAIALACHDRVVPMRLDLSATAELTRVACTLGAALRPLAGKAPALPGSGQAEEAALAALRALFIRLCGASEADVLPPDVLPPDAAARDGDGGRRLRALLVRACGGDTTERASWTDEDGDHTALALSLPLVGGARLAVGAVWSSARSERSGESGRADAAGDEALLVAFCGACALVLGPDGGLNDSPMGTSAGGAR